MGSLELTYALPVSCIQVEGTITETHDTVLKTTTRIPKATVALHVHGLLRNQTLRVKTGALRDTNLTLQLTDDGRLESAESESTGQLGKVVLGVVGAGATVAGMLVNPAATAVAAAGTAAAAGGREAFVDDRPTREKTPAERVAEAYTKAHGELAALRAHYLSLVDHTVAQIADLAAQLVGATDPDDRRRLIRELRRSQELLPVLRAELEPLNAHFKAWRASTITSRVEQHQRCFSLDALRRARLRVDDGEVHYAHDADPAIVFAWTDLGVAVTMDPAGSVATEPSAEPVARSNEILTREPRRVQLTLFECDDGKAVLAEQRPHLVVDAASPTQTYKLRRSLWAKRSVKLGFSELGVVTSFTHGATSSASAAAEALGGLPGGIAGGLESAVKIRTQVAALQTSALGAELDAAKKRVELKQQEMTAAGLAATEADNAELERLKQQAELAEKRKTVRESAEPAAPTGVAAEIAELKQQLQVLTLRRDVGETLEKMRRDAENRADGDGHA